MAETRKAIRDEAIRTIKILDASGLSANTKKGFRDAIAPFEKARATKADLDLAVARLQGVLSGMWIVARENTGGGGPANTGFVSCLQACETEYTKCGGSYLCSLQASKCIIKCSIARMRGNAGTVVDTEDPVIAR